MKLFFTRLLSLYVTATATSFAEAPALEPTAQPISIEDKKQEFVSQLNATCLTQTNKFVAMFDAHGLQIPHKINQQAVCTCVENKMREDKYLHSIYTHDKTNPFQGYDKLKFKQYMGARHTAFLMSCLAPELEKVSAVATPLPTL
jgi:hypothetical protein